MFSFSLSSSWTKIFKRDSTRSEMQNIIMTSSFLNLIRFFVAWRWLARWEAILSDNWQCRLRHRKFCSRFVSISQILLSQILFSQINSVHASFRFRKYFFRKYFFRKYFFRKYFFRKYFFRKYFFRKYFFRRRS